MFKWLQQRLFRKPYEVSIIIPTYNNVEFLEECISSVITSASECCEYEILLGIDNCAKTLKFTDKCNILKNKNIKIFFFPKNVGPYIIKNSLASKAKYDNLLFFDSDDVMMKDTMEILMYKFTDNELLKFKFYNFENELGYKNASKLALSTIFSHGSFLIKKIKFYKMNGFFGWKCGADTEFDDRCNWIKQKIYKLDIPIFYRRYHDKNITRVPETGLNSKLRSRYGKIIMENRINRKWKNPDKPQVFKSNFVKI